MEAYVHAKNTIIRFTQPKLSDIERKIGISSDKEYVYIYQLENKNNKRRRKETETIIQRKLNIIWLLFVSCYCCYECYLKAN